MKKDVFSPNRFAEFGRLRNAPRCDRLRTTLRRASHHGATDVLPQCYNCAAHIGLLPTVTDAPVSQPHKIRNIIRHHKKTLTP